MISTTSTAASQSSSSSLSSASPLIHDLPTFRWLPSPLQLPHTHLPTISLISSPSRAFSMISTTSFLYSPEPISSSLVVSANSVGSIVPTSSMASKVHIHMYNLHNLKDITANKWENLSLHRSSLVVKPSQFLPVVPTACIYQISEAVAALP